MLEGRSASERITASPRKMCVPGVQACATDGVSTSRRRTTSATLPADAARECARTRRLLNADALTLGAYSFAEIGQLVLYDIVDRFTRGVDVITHLLDDIV